MFSEVAHMDKAILGKKLGMTQMFTETGEMIPVTAYYRLARVQVRPLSARYSSEWL